MTAQADETRRAEDAAREVPWEERPAGSRDVVWRSSLNPIVTRDDVPGANSIFNSAVVPFEDGYAGVFRVDDTRRLMNLHAGRSVDGVAWEIEREPISFAAADGRVGEIQARFEHAYDPRVTWLEDRYWVTWCNGYHGPTIGLAYTYDFRRFTQLDNAFLPFNRNGVLFITHDLSLGNYISDRTVILRHGEIVEAGATSKVFGNPLHPYTRMLLTSVPQLHSKWDATAPRPEVEQTREETAAHLVEVEPDHLVAAGGGNS